MSLNQVQMIGDCECFLQDSGSAMRMSAYTGLDSGFNLLKQVLFGNSKDVWASVNQGVLN